MGERCPHCGSGEESHLADFIRGDVVCQICGCVLPDRIVDEGLEKRNFADSGKDHSMVEYQWL